MSVKGITPRQLEVGRLIAQGLTNPEIAWKLGISPRTVRSHSDALKAALGIELRRHIAHALRQRGLV